MRRTQIYMDDKLWRNLQARARREKTTASELIRRAVREKYMGPTERRQALLAWAGSRRNFGDIGAVEPYVRQLRRGSRLDQLAK